MRKLHVLSLILNLLSVSLLSQNNLIDFGSEWKYYDLGDEPSMMLGKDFEDIGYNDSSWPTGFGQLGYGDGDETTVLTNPVNGNTLITAYFRKEFTVSNPNEYSGYFAELLFDDAAVVYLNGSEIGRINFNFFAFDPGYSTLGNASSGDNALIRFDIDPSDLNAGTNTIAVEVHQDSQNSSDLSFDLAIAPVPPIVRGPYLQKLTPGSIVVKWRTGMNMQSKVKYGLVQNVFPDSIETTALITDHEAEITGLASNQKYYYFLMNGMDTILAPSPDQYFITSPPHGTVQPVTAWILGDPGTANGNARAVRDAYYNYIGTDHTDMMLFLGDNAYDSGTDNEYQFAMFENMYEDKLKNTVAWSCLGNHDGYTANSADQSGPYYDIFTFPTNAEAGGVASGTEAYYSFDYANIHFIVLESYETDRSVEGAMYNWAEMDIQNTTQEWIVAFWHHPAYTKGSHNSDSEVELIQMRENFLPMLEENGVDLVLSGHSHSYERSYFINGHYGNSTSFDANIHTVGPNGDGDGQIGGDGFYGKDLCSLGSVYITTGSAGKITGGSLNHPVFHYSASLLGSVVMEVEGDQMDIKFVRETGAVNDFFTIKKGNFGYACDDGDPCTINDIIDASCNCIGVQVPPMDSDNDGTDDCLDGCPNDPLKTEPGICGCGISETTDTDMDGTLDCQDGCINDPLKTDPGICGCGISDTLDSDSDGVVDCLDNCPNDPDKTDPGICGCDFSDILDSDIDGVVDCLDNCPNDPDKTEPGICGCGNIDADSDGNGTIVCDDFCPNDPNKTVPGLCGCGVVDVDVDGNGVCDGLGLDCDIIDKNDFETNAGIWNSGGDDAEYINSILSPDGDYSMRIRDNSGDISSTFTNTLDLSQVVQLQVNFMFRSAGFNAPQSFFLEFSGDGGATYSTVKQWTEGSDFDNDSLSVDTVVVNEVMTTTSILRFRCNGNINSDEIYLDNIELRDIAIDCSDLCPNDPNKTNPGICGCGNADTDSDLDGVTDCNDNCPTDPNKTDPEICGCGVADIDSDMDNALDCNDGCPNDPNKIAPGICGCGISDIDSDLDNSVDCNDGCPNDPNKIAPGICGCGVSDMDSDVDNTVDCNDGCPNDPNKIAPGLCGCGIADIDTDMDNTVDCSDSCPNDPNKTEPGLCGCGEPDIDANNNGFCDAGEDSCDTINEENFETGPGIWQTLNFDDAERVMSTFSPKGQYSMRLRDNSGDASTTFTSNLDLTQSPNVKVAFEYQTKGFSPPQSFFIEFSNDGGSTYAVVNEWVCGTDFNDNVIYADSVELDNSQLTATSIVRFRSNGNINSDEVYLDNIQIKSCGEPCVDYKIFTDNISTDVTEKANIGIETNRVIDSPVNVDHTAGDYILLSEGFEVKNQTVFHAYINGCN